MVVRSAMTSPPVTIAPHESVAQAARMMSEHHVNRLPVVKHGKLVGIVTRADLVRAFIRTDAQIETELREDVLAHTMWIEPGTTSTSRSSGARWSSRDGCRCGARPRCSAGSRHACPA